MICSYTGGAEYGSRSSSFPWLRVSTRYAEKKHAQGTHQWRHSHCSRGGTPHPAHGSGLGISPERLRPSVAPSSGLPLVFSKLPQPLPGSLLPAAASRVSPTRGPPGRPGGGGGGGGWCNLVPHQMEGGGGGEHAMEAAAGKPGGEAAHLTCALPPPIASCRIFAILMPFRIP